MYARIGGRAEHARREAWQPEDAHAHHAVERGEGHTEMPITRGRVELVMEDRVLSCLIRWRRDYRGRGYFALAASSMATQLARFVHQGASTMRCAGVTIHDELVYGGAVGVAVDQAPRAGGGSQRVWRPIQGSHPREHGVSAAAVCALLPARAALASSRRAD